MEFQLKFLSDYSNAFKLLLLRHMDWEITQKFTLSKNVKSQIFQNFEPWLKDFNFTNELKSLIYY